MTMPHDIIVDLNDVGNDKFAPLHVACSVGNEAIVNYLLYKKHVDPNVQGRQEWVPLEIACWNGHPRIVDMLLKDKRTNLNYKHPIRGSCLHLAAKGDHFQICQVLLMVNIDLSIRNMNGQLAKDVTQSKKILDIIAWYEKNKDHHREEKITDNIKEAIEEIDSEEDPINSSITHSPRSVGIMKDGSSSKNPSASPDGEY
jgi:ankyrin repeat protein